MRQILQENGMRFCIISNIGSVTEYDLLESAEIHLTHYFYCYYYVWS